MLNQSVSISREASLAAAQYVKEKKYWLQKLSGELIKSYFPYDNDKTKDSLTSEKDSLITCFPGDVFSGLMKLSRGNDYVLHMIAAAAAAALLDKYAFNDNKDIILGAPIYKQEVESDTEFVNTVLALRIRLEENITFKDLLYKVRETMLEADENKNYPVEVLVSQLHMSMSETDFPLFDAAVLLENVHDIAYLRTVNLNMIFCFRRTGESIEMEVQYNVSRYERTTVERIAARFTLLLKQVLANVDLRLSDIDITTEEERKQLLEDFNGAVIEYPGDKTIHRLFEEQAARTPDGVSIVGSWQLAVGKKENVHFSYNELNKRSDRLAHLLIEKGVLADCVVGIMAERSVEMVIGIMGILKAGGAYMPIAPDYPQERIDYMLKDSGAKLLVTTNNLEAPDFPLLPATGHRQPATSLAYVLYTSGSTGWPKGVMIEHRNVVNLVWGLWERIYKRYSGARKVALVSPYVFDASVKQIFAALLLGHTLCIVPEETRIDGAGLIEFYREQGIDISDGTPTHLRLMKDAAGSGSREVPFRGLSTKHFIIGGESMSRKIVEAFLKGFPDDGRGVIISNVYGPTECCVDSTSFDVSVETLPLCQRDIIPIGRPMPNEQIYILNSKNQLQPMGVPGELCIGGDGVGRGYLKQPELTAEKFDQDLWDYRDYRDLKKNEKNYKQTLNQKFFEGSRDTCGAAKKKGPWRRHITRSIVRCPGPANAPPRSGVLQKSPPGLLYKTGDLARWLPDGNIEFLGRLDYQVKIRGFRIELGEIESLLSNHEAVKGAVVVDIDMNKKADAGEGGEDKSLCAYVVVDQAFKERVKAAEFREYLLRMLPDYMVPPYFVFLERLPLTPNGKIDRKSLPEPDTGPEEGEYVAPRTFVEKKLVEIWSEVLRIDKSRIGIDTGFFNIGGQSLKAMVLCSDIHRQLNVKVPLIELFKRQTIRGLSGYIRGVRQTRYASVEPVEKKEYYALSSAQKRLYFLQQMDFTGTAYNMPLVLSLGKDIEKNRLESTLKKLIRRHESLRTSFEVVDGEPVQRIHEEVEFEIEYYDLAAEGTEEKRKIRDSFVRRFDLSRAPLIRSGFIGHPDGNHTWMVDIHHIVSDGTSHTVLTGDFVSLYNEETLAPLRLQYKDFSAWQNHLFASGEIKPQEDYWLELYSDAAKIPRLELPTDYKRPRVFTFTGAGYGFMLDREDTDRFRALGAKTGGTLYMNILAILDTLFFRYTGQTDIVIGSGTAGRPHADLQRIIGMFVNMLAVRNQPQGEKTYESFLGEVIDNSLKALENQDVQFEELVDRLGLERDLSRNPLFDIAMVVQNFGDPEEVTAENLRSAEYTEYTNPTAKFDMTFFILEPGDDVYIRIEYYTGIFREETVKRLSRHFKTIIKTVTRDPSVKLRDIDIISEEEKRQVLYEFNDTAGEYPADKTISELFEEQAARTPDSIGIVGSWQLAVGKKEKMHIDYGLLNEKAGQLAHVLKEKGVLADSIVGIMAGRSIEMIIGILGILKAGGAYLPIDPDWPRGRIDYMLKDSGAELLVTADNLETPEFPLLPAAGRRPPATSLAYVIYTSGTTGQPKGVLTTHYNVTRVVRNTNYIAITPFDRVLQLSNYAFDGSVFDIYGALLNSAALVMIDREDVLAVDRLAGVIKREAITVFFATTALFNALVDVDIGCLAGVRKVLFGGERVSPGHSGKALEYLGKGRIIHVYGPTETTVYATYYFIDGIDERSGTVPIGRPISNTTVYIVDKYWQPVPPGVSGEVYIGGTGTARGYLNNPELTAEKFFECGFYRSYRTHRTYILYRTGDLARWLPGGNIEFIGRIDDQVKIRGFRIEPGEIESRLLNHNRVKEAVVLTRENSSGDKFLCAYVAAAPVKQNEPDVTVSELREYLAGDLPDYMIPPHIVILDKMPLMPNGKIDRAALPVPEEGAAARRSVYTAPGNRVEKKLVEIWSEVLSVDRDILGIDANFFEVGGHSLKAFLLVSKIHKTFEVNVPLTEIFSHPTIREMAGYIEASKRDRFFMIDPPELKEYYPLSSAQKRLYILQQMDPGGTAYNMLFFMTLEGKLETVEFESTFKKLVDRHESLRTSFEMVGGEPVQRIHQDVEFENEYYDLTAGGIITNFTRSFDLLRPPLLRTGLIREEEQKHLLMVDMHHIISDGTSLGIFAREFMSLYNGEDLPPLTIQYKDFSQWQNRLFQSEEMKRQESFWLDQFEGDVPVLELPSDFNRPRVLTFEGSYMSTSIGAKETAALKELALEEGVTLFMVLTVVFNILFARLSGQEDIVIGTPTAGRRHVDLQGVIGMFVNTLPLRNFPNGEKTIIAFLREVKEQTLRAFDNQDYPFEELVNRLGVVRDTSRNPLFDVMFSMQNLDMPEVEIPGITLKPHPAGLNIAKFDMVATITEAGEMLSFDINYRTALFKPETIEKFFAYFSNVLSSFLENPHQRTADVRMITDAEKQQVLYDFNQTAEDYPADKTICELFEEQAGMRPDHAAVIGVDQRLGARGYAPLHMDHVSLTYRELNEKSNRLAHYLVERGVTPGRPVGILADRSPGMIIGILGILKAGCGYVPLDPRAPLTRTNYILGECRVKIVLTLTHLINRDNTFFENYLYLCIDEYESYSNRPDTDPGKNPAAGDWAYVIFTSGSTGKPKGVPITHANISPLLHWGYRHLEMGPKDRSLQNLSYYFDWAVWEIFITLTTGAGLYMVPEDLLLNPKECIAFIRKHDITVLHATPSHYRYFVNVGQRLETLKYLLLGAEKLTQDLVQRSFESVSSHCRVFNMYGPTETTIISAVLEIQREEQDKFQHLSGVPIGSPVANTTLLVLDSNLNLCPVNVTGELYIGGDGTAAGYLNRPELTAEKFKEHRSYRSYRSYSLYRTGDLARWLPDGNIEFLGRKDFQVKVRGYRIELGEIEACLSKHPKVKEAVILAMTNEGGNKFFCAYVILSGSFYNPSAMTEELKNYLSRLLPDYMVPSHFVELEKIPMTRNGKIDRKALPQPVFHAAADYIKPQTPGEKAVAFIWREVLGVDDVGIDDNFFELGGNSLNIIQLGLRLKEALRNDIPTVVLFRFPTIRTFLEYVQKEEGGDREKEKEKDRLKVVDRGKRMMTRAINRRDMKGV